MSSENSTNIYYNFNLTTQINNENDVNKEEIGQLRFIFVPLSIFLAVIIFILTVCMLARKRKLDNLRHRLMPLYSFDKNEQESDWETDCLNTVDNPNYTETSSFINNLDK